MDERQIKFIYSGELTVAATIESGHQEEFKAAYPMTVLLYLELGDKCHRLNDEVKCYPQGSYLLIRKFTDGVLYKSLKPGQKISRSYAFALTDEYIRRIINQFSFPPHITPVPERIVRLKKNHLLEKLMKFIKKSLNHGKNLKRETLNQKTKEALIAILKADPSLVAVFREYTLAQRADLEEFMNQSYLLKIPLKSFAMQSGRSLSTFHRDFKMIFAETPHQWIMKKRLYFAKELLKEGNSVSSVYMSSGFEDLAHFSRAFKKQFGYPPSKQSY